MSAAPNSHRVLVDDPTLVAANGPDPRMLLAEVDRARQVMHDLRDSAGAIRLAVQVLAGPLRTALHHLAPAERARVDAVLESLQVAAGDLCTTVDARRQTPPDVSTVAVVPPPEANASVDDILQRLEVLSLTRGSTPAMVAIDALPGLKAAIVSSELLRCLTEMVSESVGNRRGAGPHTVALRVYLDPVEDLGDAMHVVFDVVEDGTRPPGEVLAGLTRTREALESCGGFLEAHNSGAKTLRRARVPQAQ